MNKSYGRIFSILAAVIAASPLQAAIKCDPYTFIYRSAFELGDGEGMETRQCNEANFNKGDATLKKLQDMVKAGHPQQAHKELERALSVNHEVEYRKWQANAEICVRPAQIKSFENLIQEIGKKMAAESERAGKTQQAIATNIHYCLHDEAARIHLAQAEKKPANTQAVRDAYAFGKQYARNPLMQNIRQIASTASNQYLTEENNFFKSNIYNSHLLEQAIKLHEAVEDKSGKDNIIKKAGLRGDELGRQDNCRILESAIGYYDVADNEKMISAIRNKAMKIGEGLEKQGNLKAAAACYETADAEEKSGKLRHAVEAESEKEQEKTKKNEKSRQEKFNREQDDLEKELQL
ncbi:MAG: hypothetical protein QG652_853 [Pseudomonadota bacterium]|nr:hypothetical protein [Pseudomonadota bacterium]